MGGEKRNQRTGSRAPHSSLSRVLTVLSLGLLERFEAAFVLESATGNLVIIPTGSLHFNRFTTLSYFYAVGTMSRCLLIN